MIPVSLLAACVLPAPGAIVLAIWAIACIICSGPELPRPER